MNDIEKCNIVTFPEIKDARGNLSFAESGRHVSFDIKRVFYLYNIHTNRGAHAHKVCQQMIIAISGCFDVTIDDGRKKKKFSLNEPHRGLYLCPMIWCDLDNFSSDAVCLVLASDFYDETDYIRDYQEFIKLSNSENENPVS